jgi:hypothetical protein
MGDTTVFVDCVREGKVLRTYDFLVPATIGGPSEVLPTEHFIGEAKYNLSIERLAVPPFNGITFKVRR